MRMPLDHIRAEARSHGDIRGDAIEAAHPSVALAVYARQVNNRTMEKWATEIRFRAERGFGALLKETADKQQRRRVAGVQALRKQCLVGTTLLFQRQLRS